MARNLFGMSGYDTFRLYLGQQKKKRKTLTPAQRIYIWERPSKYKRICSICGEKITKLSDLELDHTRAYSKGGTKLALAHRECNRHKSSGSLRQIQKQLGIKSKTKKRVSRKKSRRRHTYYPVELRMKPIKFY